MRWFDARARARQWQIEQLPTMLHALARAVRAGKTLPTALQSVAADATVSGPELQRAAQRVRDGARVHDEIDRWAASLAHRDADLVRAVVNTGAATGSALAASLDRAAGSLQERADLQREIAALTSQARTSALLLTVAPFAFLMVIAMVDPSVVAATLATAPGRIALVIGVVLDAAGWAWMRHQVQGVDR
ncbi:MAG: type II secretion system F family protein [Acidimicrobiales bacterium]